jgi:hypothetical protein
MSKFKRMNNKLPKNMYKVSTEFEVSYSAIKFKSEKIYRGSSSGNSFYLPIGFLMIMVLRDFPTIVNTAQLISDIYLSI